MVPDTPTNSWPAPPQGSRVLPGALEVEIAILGAGIHGCALARELTLRGISCAVVDKGAIAGGTSQRSSQLLHGGIRYLLTRDIRQMREGLAERAIWAHIAPWRVRWESFWMPHHGLLEGLSQRIGIGLYDHWGSDRPGWPKSLPLGGVPHPTFEADPRRKDCPYSGATAYADLLTWDGDLVRDLAASSTAAWLDFHEVIGFEERGGQLRIARLRDRRDGSRRGLSAQRWVFALGPWMDGALRTWFDEPSERLRLSSGIHLWFDAVPGCQRPWAIRRPGGRILFVIPRDGMLQVGTTEREVQDGWTPPIEAEREELYQALEANLPGLAWRTFPVRMEQSGVRPLVAAKPAQTARLSREAILETHPRFQNLTLVLGGKLTTARALMAKLAADLSDDPCPISRSAPLVKWDGQSP